MESLAEALGQWLAKLLRLEGPVVALLARVLTIAGALVLAVIAYRAGSHLIDRLLRPPEGTADYSQKTQRARTLGPLLKSFGEAEIVLRLQVKVLPPQRFDIENELRRRILEEFRTAGIREPKKVVHVVQERSPGGDE